MPRPPLTVGVADLRKRPGSRVDVEREVPARDLGDLEVIDTRVLPEDSIALDLTLESIPDGVVVTGSVEVPYAATCRRCLGDVRGTMHADVREIFESHPTEGETYPIGQDEIDLEPLVRETVLLGLPPAPLCSEDCKGPVPEAFAGDEPEAEREPDPRWAALEDLDFDR